MKLTHKQKIRRARQMMSAIERSTYWHDSETKTLHRKPRTPLFQSKRWNEMKQAKANREHERQTYGGHKIKTTANAGEQGDN